VINDKIGRRKFKINSKFGVKQGFPLSAILVCKFIYYFKNWIKIKGEEEYTYIKLCFVVIDLCRQCCIFDRAQNCVQRHLDSLKKSGSYYEMKVNV
jgi:hypothetical protein